MVEHLEWLFPGLAGTKYRITSPLDDKYNCIAWALGDTKAWWWPFGYEGRRHWPTAVVRAETLEAFATAFAALGFLPCAAEELEIGFEKLALFADAADVPTHAARQLPTGFWTSKLGLLEDLEHELRALEGRMYGRVRLLFRRPLPTTTTES